MKQKKETNSGGFFVSLSAPAQRALENKGIFNVKDLSNLSKAELSKLHGIGPGSFPKLEQVLHDAGLSFKNES
jgi:hypothetical protein